MKPALRGATTADIELAEKFRRSMRDYAQENILLMFAIVYNDWRALQGTIARQREALSVQAESQPGDKRLVRQIAQIAPSPETATLEHVRAKHRSKHGSAA